MEARDPVAYLIRGNYIHPECARSRTGYPPVYASDLPSEPVWCRACEDPILPVEPREPCVFCEIVAGRVSAEWILQPDYWPDAVVFIPLNPVTEGHCLIVPKVHVEDFAADPEVYASVSRRAAELMRWTPRPMNVITSRGVVATQSVFHLHVHLVPRAENDGLALPWYSGKTKKRKP